MVVTSKLDRYRRISTLGAGGMGTVVLAEDTLLGRKVALKWMTSTTGARGALRLRREALVGASLSHPNLVSIYDIFTSEDGGHVIVMEYVEGENLRDALAREGRLPPQEVLRILGGVAAALDAIHGQGIVHRDVKPANILLGADGAVKLADLGIASAPDHTRITSTDAVVGSYRYMAPEQLRSAPSTPAIDVYALAAVAFEALSGRKARADPNPMALAHAIATQPPPNLRDAWPEAPLAAADVLAMGMSREPARRPRSAGELVRRLRAALEPEPTDPTPTVQQPRVVPYARFPARQRSRLGPAVAALIALAAAAVALVVLTGRGSKPTRTTAAAGHTHAAARSRGAKRTTGAATSASSSSTAPAVSAPAGGSATRGPAVAAGSSPVSVVESFYNLAASHNYGAAWALADSAFQSQLGGYQSFAAGQSGDRSIKFDSAQVVHQSSGSATVAVSTTSVRTDGTKHCAGTVDLSALSGRWLLHQIHINCS